MTGFHFLLEIERRLEVLTACLKKKDYTKVEGEGVKVCSLEACLKRMYCVYGIVWKINN